MNSHPGHKNGMPTSEHMKAMEDSKAKGKSAKGKGKSTKKGK